MTIDAHVHLWNRATDPQDWIDPESMQAIDRDFGADDLSTMLDAAGIGRAVVVQSSNSIDETRRLLALAAPRIAGVVGWIDLVADVPAQLDSLGTRAPVGIRHLVHVDPDPAWLARDEVGSGLDALGRAGLAFDLVLHAPQLALAAGTVGRHEGTRFVLDHLGGVAETDDVAAWEVGLRSLAAHPHVVAKISGLWRIDSPGELRRIADVALDAFGPDRLMYGSDWPMARMGADAPAWRRTFDELVAGLSAGERADVLSGTAERAYGLAAA